MVTSADVVAGVFGGRTIRVLFYVDHRDGNWQAVPQPGVGQRLRGQPTEFGLRIAKDLLQAQSTIFLRFEVDVLNRHYDYDSEGKVVDYGGPMRTGKHKLTASLLKRYDQVWFFGQLYANFRQADPDYGNEESELTDAEVAALRAWMDAGGGVLMTGDHSNDVTYWQEHLVDSSLGGKILNLGRALGHRVPRAGAMRIWVGEPGASDPHHPVDTAGDPNMAYMPKQEDAIPQQIRVAQVAHRISISLPRPPFPGDSILIYDEHPLFKTRPTADFPSSVIDILPDHVHEGAVAVPNVLDPAEWPRRGSRQPQPEVIAWGTNWHAQQRGHVSGGWASDAVRWYPEVGVVAAYDGDKVGVGRIVSHSTWHHFVNVNLVGFRRPDGSPGPVLDRLGAYLSNLATWLSPRKQRLPAFAEMIRWTSMHPAVREVRGSSSRVVGQTAAEVLMKIISPGVYADLAQLSTSALQLPESSDDPSATVVPQLPHHLILGCAIHAVVTQRREKEADDDAGPMLLEATKEAVRLVAQHNEAEARGLRALSERLRFDGEALSR